MMRFGYGTVWFGLGWIFMLGICVLIVLGIIALWRYLKLPAANQKKTASALDILNERYARGEISDDDYTRMKNQLYRQ